MLNNLPDTYKEFIGGNTALSFDGLALEIFRFQYHNNAFYKKYADALHIVPGQVQALTDIPFLPIHFFKSQKIKSGNWQQEELYFESSTTTSDTPGRHFVADASIYNTTLLSGFAAFYGPPKDYVFLALLPSYLERGRSSLVHMVQVLMQESNDTLNGFYLYDHTALYQALQAVEQQGKKAVLIGVTYALLDFAAAYPFPMRNTIVMETGGMKGKREEWTKDRVHDYLKAQWQLETIHSEYGMTELLSQSYAVKDGIFRCSKSVKILVRDINDPLETRLEGSGAVNVIDLANIYSCCFIATEDVGKVYPDGHFEIMGRMDAAALRGCNLMVL